MGLDASWSATESMIGQLSREDFATWALKHAWEASYLTRPQSCPQDGQYLSIDFLRMYLAHETSTPAITTVGRWIAASSDFEHLRLGVEHELQLKATRRGRRSTAAEIAADAREYLQLVRATVGIRFEGKLRRILSSVEAIDVPLPATILKIESSLFREVVDYELDVVMMNTFDFVDLPSGADEVFCKRLLTLLADERYFDFRCEYLWATIPHTHRLAESTVFAAFMHSLEAAGFTRGPLAWTAAVPLRGRLSAPSDAAARELAG